MQILRLYVAGYLVVGLDPGPADVGVLYYSRYYQTAALCNCSSVGGRLRLSLLGMGCRVATITRATRRSSLLLMSESGSDILDLDMNIDPLYVGVQ